MVLYWDYLNGDEGAIRKTIDYNEDDCRAMYYTDSSLCRMFGLPFPGRSAES